MASIRGGQRAAERIRNLGQLLRKPVTVRVGFLAGATYPNGTPVAMVAAIQEYGAPRAGIPPRPFFRTMIASKSPEWPAAIAENLKANNYDPVKTMDQVGGEIAGQLVQSIVEVTAPPLSPVTLMLRKMFGNSPERITFADVLEARRRVAAGMSTGGVSTKPLVWTGHLLNSVDHEVKT